MLFPTPCSSALRDAPPKERDGNTSTALAAVGNDLVEAKTIFSRVQQAIAA